MAIHRHMCLHRGGVGERRLRPTTMATPKTTAGNGENLEKGDSEIPDFDDNTEKEDEIPDGGNVEKGDDEAQESLQDSDQKQDEALEATQKVAEAVATSAIEEPYVMAETVETEAS